MTKKRIVIRLKARELYAIYKSAFARANNMDENIISSLTWEELSVEGRKAWIAVARKANNNGC